MKAIAGGSRWLGIVLVVLGASSYGFVSPITKAAYQAGWGSGAISASMLIWGTVMTWITVALRPKIWRNPFKGPWIRLSLTGILGLTLTTVFLNKALTELNASLAIVLLFQFTWITMLIEAMLNRKLPNRWQMTAILLIAAGTIFSVGLSASPMSAGAPAGWIYGLLSAITYSMFILFIGKIKTNMDSTLSSAIMLTAGLLVIGLWIPGPQLLQAVGFPILKWGLLLGVLGPVLPTVLFNLGIPRVGGTMAAILGSMELPVAVLAAHFMIGESVLPMQVLGIGLILIGIVLAQRTDA